MKLLMSLNNRVYNSESVTMTVHDFNYIHFMQKVLHVCTHIYTHYLVNRRDNFHYVSKSIDCKLCNYLQYVDIVFITVCFYQVDIVHNAQFIFMPAFLLCLSQCICFHTYYVTHFVVL